MATTTPNFGWPVPTSTDLVKNGATAIEGLGDAIDASLLDLKGGTTGQVLAKATNTDMDFSWVAQDDSNAIQNAIVDAKGDLIAASANDTPARLAVGNNGETLVADSSTATGLKWAAPSTGSSNVAGKNGVLNSNFSVWQRGTSISLAASAGITYLADRWATQTAANQACTVSRQATGDTTNLPFIQYALRYQRNSGQTGTDALSIIQPFETVNSIPFAGKTVTFSFYARAGANFSAASSLLYYLVRTGTGTDQMPFNAYTGGSTSFSAAVTLTTTWQRFTASATIPTTATEIAPQFYFIPVGTAGANDYYEVTGVQLETASSATAYSPNAATFQGELAACQRYYIRTTGNNSSALLGTLGFAKSTSLAVMPFALPITMRTAVSAIDVGGTPQIADGNTGYSGGTWALDSTSSTNCTVTYTHGSASLTQYRPYFPQATTGTSYIGFSAEL